jgi:hypothetical protein
MKRFFVFCVLLSSLAACNKDKFKTQPQVTINSLNPSEVTKGQIFTLNATVTDQEGDLQNKVLLVRKRYTGAALLSVDTVSYDVSTLGFPTKQQIEISAIFSYGNLQQGAIFQNLETVDRNFAVGVIVIDAAGNRSDYVESNQILLKKL